MTRDLLIVDKVRKSFGGLIAVGGDAGLSFSVPEGTFLGLIGPNGAGKSTTFNLISGVLKPTSGAVLLDGRDLSKARASDIASYGLGRTFQTPRAFPSLTVLENVMVGADNQGETLFSVLRGGWRSRETALRDKAGEVLERVGLSDRIDDVVANLSGGELHMLEVARQLVRDPRILLLDEPTAGVDPSLQAKLSRILVDLHSEGRTLVVVEHNLHFLLQIADSIVVLQNGQLLSRGTPSEIKSDEKVIAAYLGADHAA